MFILKSCCKTPSHTHRRLESAGDSEHPSTTRITNGKRLSTASTKLICPTTANVHIQSEPPSPTRRLEYVVDNEHPSTTRITNGKQLSTASTKLICPTTATVTTQCEPPKVELKQKQVHRIESMVEWDSLCLMHEMLTDNCPQLRCSKIDKNVYYAVRDKKFNRLANIKFCLNQDNYADRLTTLLLAEEIYESIEMRKYDLYNQRVKVVPDPKNIKKHLLQVRLPSLSSGQPSLIPMDNVVLEEFRVYEVCKIVDIEGDLISFKQPDKRKSFCNPGSNCFNISFVSSGISYGRYYQAIDYVRTRSWFRKFLFEDLKVKLLVDHQLPMINVNATKSKMLEKRLLSCNDRQRQAIDGILEARCRPMPYILFGPPGTGKTFTLVEAVVQIYNRNSGMRILVCANSNNCADQLVANLKQTKLVQSIRRLHSFKNYESLSKKSDIHITSRDKSINKARIIVTTNSMSGTLFDSKPFDYVFIDEAGHAHEPESLIPMSNLRPNGCIVLAGDPKQLGPVIHCKEVERLGLGESMLERLFRFDIYSHKNGSYDANYITKLIVSYRCDPRILALSNKLFYGGELECRGQTPAPLLKQMSFSRPLIFHRVKGHERKTADSTSRCNDNEADICVDYVIRLYGAGIEPDKIGIISPYKLQKELIQKKLRTRIRSEIAELRREFKNARLTLKESSLSIDKVFKQPLGGGTLVDLTNCNKIDANKCRRDLVLAKGKASNKDKTNTDPKQANLMCKIDTVDAFQGKEKEIIIISTVRTPNKFGSILQCGFLTDAKRFNVAISRAKWIVIVVGHPAVLGCHENWRLFGSHAAHLK